jgi:hypothetical protein
MPTFGEEMTDRLKGVLVTFDKDIRDDDAKPLIEALKMIKGVQSVKPYVSGGEDYMMYHRGYQDCKEKIWKQLMKESKDPE